ncbi:hypothetical protein EV702DRAFT_1072731 [Suillus placidus]|uniref:Ricin B lectin domain-containing protein n=1 Tax=Suillus placidus TaxID=48579 RepID=A0A9P7A4M4_9AGAM|nr:hypothetical protein EV702DRAFT_1072731 [Suillus placidus]
MPLDTTVKYLIQHSETGEYLSPGGSSVTTKALSKSEKDSLMYQWTIKEGYLISNVAKSQLLVPGSPGEFTAVLEVPTQNNQRFKWNISSEEVGKPVQLTLKAKGIAYYMYTTSKQNSVKISSQLTEYGGHESWILDLAAPPKAVIPSLLPMKNPLPSGSYRIRAFNGSFLLTMPNNTLKQKRQDNNVYVNKRQSNADAAKCQRWEVELLEDSGLYTIKNSGTGLYLAPNSNRWLQGDMLVGLDNFFSKWSIQTTDMGVMFFIGLLGVQSSLSIGFPNYEGGDLSEVELEPSDSVPSQIWFFESLDVNPAAPGQDVMHTTSILEERDYYIRSWHDDKIYLSIESGNVKLKGATLRSKFTLTYPSDKSGSFKLSYTSPVDDGDDDTYHVTDASGLLDLRDENETLWVVIPHHGESGTVYHICDSITGSNAISSRPKNNGNKVVVDPMVEGDEVQWWGFEPVVVKK